MQLFVLVKWGIRLLLNKSSLKLNGIERSLSFAKKSVSNIKRNLACNQNFELENGRNIWQKHQNYWRVRLKEFQTRKKPWFSKAVIKKHLARAMNCIEYVCEQWLQVRTTLTLKNIIRLFIINVLILFEILNNKQFYIITISLIFLIYINEGNSSWSLTR